MCIRDRVELRHDREPLDVAREVLAPAVEEAEHGVLAVQDLGQDDDVHAEEVWLVGGAPASAAIGCEVRGLRPRDENDLSGLMTPSRTTLPGSSFVGARLRSFSPCVLAGGLLARSREGWSREPALLPVELVVDCLLYTSPSP